MYGLNIDPHNPLGNPEASEMQELGVQMVRFTFKVARPNAIPFYQERIQSYASRAVRSVVIMTNESVSQGKPSPSASDAEWDGYITNFIREISQTVRAFVNWNPIIQIWNEPDHPPKPGYEPTLRPDVFGRMLRRAYAEIKGINPNLKVITAGLASGHPSWLQQVINSLGGQQPYDAVGVHPYAKRPQPDWPDPNWGTGYAGDLLTAYRRISNKPIWVTEMGINTPNQEFQAEFLRRFYQDITTNFKGVVEEVQWFCYSDGMVDLFGLRDHGNNRKPGYFAYQEIAHVAPPPPIEPPLYAVEYVSDNTPPAMLVGQANAVQITIRNTSRQTWLADGPHKVRLGYHWYTTGGQPLSPDLWEDRRTHRPVNLQPNQSVTLNAELAAPQVTGEYELRWDMVEEMKTWFSWQGVPTLNRTITVGQAAPPPPPPGEMAARARPHHVQQGYDNLPQAFDNNPFTRWSTTAPQRPGMWFELDLGSPKTISYIQLDNEPSPMDYPRGYIIRVSTDRQQWATVAENPNNDGPVSITFTPRKVRFIRVEQTGSDPQFWWSIHEVRVTAAPSLTARASHNNVLAGADNLSQALDGLAHTRWSTRALQRPGMWFELDLKEPQQVLGLALDSSESPNDYPRGYVVRLSQDRQNWQEVARQDNNTRSLNTWFRPHLARYIRVEQTGSSNSWWWSIHEVRVRSEAIPMSAVASHNNHGVDNVMQALDLRPETRWSTQAPQRPGMWFELDLQAPRTVTGLRLDNIGSPNDYPRGYIVRLSSDRQNWHEVARQDNNTAPLDVDFSARSARYIRVEQTGSSNSWWWSIHEVDVKLA